MVVAKGLRRVALEIVSDSLVAIAIARIANVTTGIGIAIEGSHSVGTAPGHRLIL